MTPAELMALAQQLLYDCCDPVTGEPLYTGQSSYACVEDVEAAAHYLRDCAETEPVATVRVHDTGGNAGIAWTGVPTENSGVMRGGTPLYEHPQPPSTQAEPVAWRITDGEGGYDYRDDPPEDWQVAWVARWGRKHEPLYTQPHPQPPSEQADAIEALRMALDALSCTGDPDDPGHRCGHCDEYVDRNSVVRKLIRAVLVAHGGNDA